MSDILWQDSSSNVAIWEMNGITVLNPNSLFVSNVAGAWSIQLTGDCNGDGKSDIVWHDTSGNVASWEMEWHNLIERSTSFVSNVAGQWSIQRLAAD
jgi:serralysin